MQDFFGSQKPELPAHKVYRWKSTKKAFTYWDKEATEEKKLDYKDLELIVLTQTRKFTGFIEAEWTWCYSNEFTNFKKDIITVRAWKQIIGHGKFHEINEAVKAKWAQFTNVVYASLNWEFCKFELAGSANSWWIDSCQNNGVSTGKKIKVRSEEHTSELQSHSDLVCRLLLEKKKENVVMALAQLRQGAESMRTGEVTTYENDAGLT